MQTLSELPDGIASLLGTSRGRNVSIFLPAVRAGPETRQNPVRLRNLIREAERRLADSGGEEAKEVLRPAREALDEPSFWRHPADGLCLLLSPELSWRSWLPVRCDETVTVGDAFHVAPLVPLVADRTRYNVLALGRDDVRLLRGDRFGLEAVDTGDAVARALGGVEAEEEKQLQFHTGTPARPGARDAVFFGTGAGDPDPKDETLRAFRRVDAALAPFFGEPPAPLVLCGADALPPLYRSASSHPRILPEDVSVRPFELEPADLHRRTWSVARPLFEAERGEARQRYRELAGRGEPRASDRPRDIVPAAEHGRVEVLLTDGRAGRDRDRAVVETLRHGGRVFVLDPDELPESGAAAIFRF